MNPEGRFDNLSRFYQEDVASCEDKFTKMFGEKIIEDCIVEEQFTIFTITTRWVRFFFQHKKSSLILYIIGKIDS